LKDCLSGSTFVFILMPEGRASEVGSYLPSTLLGRLPRALEAAPFASAAVVRSELAAILSIDIAGFTRFTERLEQGRAEGVDQLSRLLNEFFSELIGSVEAHGGELVSILGDGTLAAWVAPSAAGLALAVERAAACGLELSRKLDGYRSVEEGTPLRVRVGLGAGPLLLARLGSTQRWVISVAGSAATDAVAAERVAATGLLAVSSAAWQMLPAKKRGRALSGDFMELAYLPTGSGSTPTRAPFAAELGESELLSYLPAPVRARVTSQAPLWQAEVRHITVAFFQLRRETGRDLTPELAQAAVRVLQSELARCGGGIDDITFHDKGCVTTAVFGLPPEAYEDDARRAVTAALSIREQLTAVAIDASVGVASGLVFWGPIGRESRRQFALLGTTMNLGCRLMQHAQSEILCCPRTLEALAGRVSGEHIGDYPLKGFDQPVSIFRASALGAPQSKKQRILGRSTERAQVLQRLEQARARQGGILWIESGPGLGKSALINELLLGARGARVPVLVARGDAIEQTTPYHAWEGPIAELLSVNAAATLAERVAAVTARIDAIAPLEGLAPLLAPILRLPLADSEKTHLLDGFARADRTADLIVLLLRQANAAGLVVVLEDLHWFDSASLRLALLVRKRQPDVPLVVTARPVAASPDEAFVALQQGAERIDLAPLEPACIVLLVANRLGAHAVSAEAERFLHDIAGGNPLFAESLARELGGDGVLTVSDGVVHMGEQAARSSERVPRSLDAIIGTRVDHLSPAVGLTLKTASVLGRSFTFAAMLAVHPSTPSAHELRKTLEALESERLIVPLEQGSSYAFDHAVTHGVSYARIPKRLRESLHASIAEWCESAYAEDIQSNYPVLAHHREQAGNTLRACEYLELAAQQALRSGAFREASRFLERALGLAQRAPLVAITPLRRARWSRQLSETHDLLGDKVRMGDCARVALRELGRPEPRTGIGRVLFALRGALVQLIPRALRSLGAQGSLNEPAFELSRAHQSLSAHYFYSLSPIGMVGNTLQATNAAERSFSKSERAKCYSGMALWLGIVGFWRFGSSYAARAVEACAEPDDPAVATQALAVAALHYVGMANFEATLRCCDAAQALAAPRDDNAWWSIAQAIRLWSHLYRGEHTYMPQLVEALRARARSADSDLLQAWAGRFEASFLLASGRTEAATALFREVLPVVRRHGDRAEVLLVLGSLVLASARAGQIERARGYLDETMTLLSRMERATSHILLEGLSHVLEGTLLLQNHAPADRVLEAYQQRALRAIRGYSRSFPIGIPRYLHFRGLVDLQLGRRRRAKSSFLRGSHRALALGMPADFALLQGDLERLGGMAEPVSALPGAGR
jgi:class 3 adenylate cyclase/tetratricopeptide (TPR) repeat protein